MPDISVSIGATNTNLQTVVGDTMKRIQGLGPGISGIGARLAALAGPALAVIGLGAGFAGLSLGIVKAIQKGRDLNDLMQRTGQDAVPLLKLSRAFKAAHLEAEGVGPAINKLQKALAGANEDGHETSSVFAKLKLNAAELAKMDSATQFAKIGTALQSVVDPAQRASLVMQIFGKSGGEFLQLFNNPDTLGLLNRDLNATQMLLAKNAGLFARISGIWEYFMSKAKGGFGLFAGIAAGLGPALDLLLNKLPKIDLSGIGQQIGNIVSILVKAFQDGRMGELLGLSLKLGVIQMINFLYINTRAFLAALGTGFLGVGKLLVDALSVLTTGSFWDGMSHVLFAGALRFSAELIRVSAYLQAGFDLAVDRLMRGILSLKGSFASVLTFFMGGWGHALIDPIGFLAGKLGDIALTFGKALLSAVTGDIAGAASAAKTMGGFGLAMANPLEAIFAAFSKSVHDQSVAGNEDNAGPSYTDLVNKRLAESQGDRNDLTSRADAHMNQSGFDSGTMFSQLATRVAGILENAQAAFDKSRKEGNGPLDGSETKAKLTQLISVIQAELEKTRTTLNARQPQNTSGPDSGDNLPERGNNRVPVSGNRSNPNASSLARLGGGGYAGNGILSLHREANALLKRIAENTVSGVRANLPSAGLGHSVSGHGAVFA